MEANLRLLIIPNHWAKAATVEECWRNIAGHAGTQNTKAAKRAGQWIVYECDEHASVDEIGQLRYSLDGVTPKVLERGKAVKP